MNLILYLYLVHFLADYTFQSSSLVKYKSEHFLGVLIHSTVHLLTLSIILGPFLPENKVYVAIAVIYLTHIAIDQTKVMLNRAYPKRIRMFYFLDQLVHMIIITACALYIGPLSPKYLTGMALEVYSNQYVILYLLTLVLATYFFDVSKYFIRKQYKKKGFKRDWPQMGINAGIITLVFAILWGIGLTSAI